MNKNFSCLTMTLLIAFIIGAESFAQNPTPEELQATGSLQDSTANALSQFEFLPILNYDTDVGFGYGIKTFFYNFWGQGESFDLTLYNSTKGERWYRLVFSYPDIEKRQGTAFDYAADVIVDYDKWIGNSFFGIGGNSKFDDREIYTREPFEINLNISRGFTKNLIGLFGLKYKSIRNFNFTQDSRLKLLTPSLNSSTVKYLSFLLSFRYDTRNSYINPTSGNSAQGEFEFAPGFNFNNIKFTRTSITLQNYSALFFKDIILASRLNAQSLGENNLPVQTLLSLGGNNTLRGFPQDRFLDKSQILANLELRFPIYWQFGGIVGLDAGKVMPSFSKINFKDWAMNPTAGLRFYMDTFVVRLDFGISKEYTGIYFNFGQIF